MTVDFLIFLVKLTVVYVNLHHKRSHRQDRVRASLRAAKTGWAKCIEPGRPRGLRDERELHLTGDGIVHPRKH